MSYTPPLDAEVTAFVTTALLASGATFDSGVLDADGKTQVQTEILASHDGTIDISFCADSGCADVVRSLSIPYVATNGYQFFAAPAFVNYIKYEFTNTTAATQTDFYYTTKFLTTGLNPQLLTTDAFIAPAMVASLGRNIQVGTNPGGTFTNAKVDGIAFQTTDNLVTGTTFSSDVIDAQGYTQVQTHIVSDQDGTLGFKFCSTSDCSGTTVGADGVERYLSVPYNSSNGFQLFAAPAFTPYVQYTFENTGTGTTTQLFYETKLLTKALSGQLLGLDAFISPAMVANLGRNVIVGENDAGSFNNVTLDNQNHLEVNVSSPKTSFEELVIANLTPTAQVTFPYNINADIIETTLLGSGTATQADNMAVISTTASITATEGATIESIKTLTFRAGQGALVRFSCLFTDLSPNGATSVQGVGVGGADDGYGFAFSGDSFGVDYRTDGVQIHIPQTSWNTDVMDGTGSGSNPSGMLLDPTQGNVYQISYGSGFGSINFSIESQTTGDMVLVHILRYANLNIVPSSYNPTFPMRAEVFKDGTSDAGRYIVKVSDMSAFIEGTNEITGPLNAHTSDVRTTSGTDGNEDFFTLRGRSTFGGKTNKVECLIESISASQDSKAGGNIFITEDATVASQNAFVDVDTNTSVVEISDSLAGENRDVSGGKLLWSAGIGKEDGFSHDISYLNLRLRPGHTLTFSMDKFQAANNEDGSISVVWKEDF